MLRRRLLLLLRRLIMVLLVLLLLAMLLLLLWKGGRRLEGRSVVGHTAGRVLGGFCFGMRLAPRFCDLVLCTVGLGLVLLAELVLLLGVQIGLLPRQPSLHACTLPEKQRVLARTNA